MTMSSDNTHDDNSKMLTAEEREGTNTNMGKSSWWTRLAVGGSLFDAFLMEGECNLEDG
jgi:hypothetical protein